MTPPDDAQLILRPIRSDELDYFEQWSSPDADPYGFFGFTSRRGLRADVERDGLLGRDSGLLLVEVGGTVIGDVGWHAEWYGPPWAEPALNIGIRLIERYRGHGYGAQAQRLLADYLLDTYPINRVEAGTDVTNVAEQRALERAGFIREGVARGAQWRAGQWHDLVVYSRLRADADRAAE